MGPECLQKNTFGASIWTQILYFFGGNEEIYYHLNQFHWVTRNTDSNYEPMKGHKNGSLAIHSQIWLGNILPISRDQYSWNQILDKKYFSGELFTSRSRLENVLKFDHLSPFQQ